MIKDLGSVNSLAIKKEFYNVESCIPPFAQGLHVNQETIDTYLAFFTQSSGADMLPYVYMESCDLYNNLIKHCKDYYLCKDETETIDKSLDQFSKYLSEITDIIEIGPGSVHAVKNKTLPILNCSKNLQRYHAIDHSKNYLEEACGFIEKELPDIDVLRIEADLTQVGEIKLNSINEGNAALLFLGSTLGNFKVFQQNNIIQQFYNLLNSNDKLIITIDTNQDEESLLKAYNNLYFYDFVMGSLKYYARINPEFKKYLTSFEAKVVLDKNLNLIDAFFMVKNDLSFYFDSNRIINLYKGQELRGIISHKPSSEKIVNLLFQNNFEVLEILGSSKGMKTFICKRL